MSRYMMCLLLLAVPSLVWAGPQDEVALNMVDRALKCKNFQATFVYHTCDDAKGAPATKLKGTITVQGNCYRLVVDNHQLFCDGTTVWTYLPEANEVQISDCNPEHGVGVLWPLHSNYRQDYVFYDSVNRHKANKKSYSRVTLAAKRADHALQQIMVEILWKGHKIRRLEVLDINAERHILDVQGLKKNIKLTPGFFKFEPASYPQVEVIDLR